ncbi:hypothetical protein EON66_08500 [archaeon]|nr:MAG: hypothetical protein EON66_08500 [archaeon]
MSLCGGLAAAFLLLVVLQACHVVAGQRLLATGIRLLMYALLHALVVPSAGALLSPFACGEEGSAWLGSGIVCGSGAHVMRQVVSIIVLVLFIPVAVSLQLLVVLRTFQAPDSRQLVSSSHGTVHCPASTRRTHASLPLVRARLLRSLPSACDVCTL